jgi:hypothetical protein
LFWPTESRKKATGICPFTEANQGWLDSSGMSELVQSCTCSEGYDLDIVNMIMHLQTHSHWISKVASLIVMEHDVTTGMHPLRGPHSPAHETASPQQPQKLFRTNTGNPKRTGESDSDSNDEPPRATLGKRRTNQLLSRIPESSSDKEHESTSGSDTASESKHYKAAQAKRYQITDAKRPVRSSTRIARNKRDLLNRADDGESSVDSALSNQEF